MSGRDEIDRVLRAAVDTGRVPGVSAMVVGQDSVLYQSAFGEKRLGSGDPIKPDTVFWYASMTKALVAAAAMQLVEQGRVGLDDPAANLLPDLRALQVLEGYDESGKPRLRPAKGVVTLRHLLTHTSGFGYDNWNASVARYMAENDLPSLGESRRRSLIQPLVADPGLSWEYGISIDWAGQVIEAVTGQTLDAYLTEHLLTPLGMSDTRFIIRPDQRPRLATVHQRAPDGSLQPIHHEISQQPEFHMGGGGLYGTVADYAAFLQMLLNDGRAKFGRQVLKPETVADMARNHVGPLAAGVLKTAHPPISYDTDFFPGMTGQWGLSFLINPERSVNGRSAGSLTWGGLANTYFWVDRSEGVAGIIATQIFPFADPIVLDLFGALERFVYQDRDPAR